MSGARWFKSPPSLAPFSPSHTLTIHPPTAAAAFTPHRAASSFLHAIVSCSSFLTFHPLPLIFYLYSSNPYNLLFILYHLSSTSNPLILITYFSSYPSYLLPLILLYSLFTLHPLSLFRYLLSSIILYLSSSIPHSLLFILYLSSRIFRTPLPFVLETYVKLCISAL